MYRESEPLSSWAIRRLTRPAALERWGRSTALGPAPESTSYSIDGDLLALLQTLTATPRLAAKARAALETIWAAGPPHRAEIWTVIHWWRRDRRWYHLRPDLPLPVMRFLLDPDPDSPYEPRIRLVTGLSLDTWRLRDNSVAASFVSMVRASPLPEAPRFVQDPQLCRDLTHVLSTTDQPELVAALERAFVSALRRYRGWGSKDDDPLWAGDGTTPTPLLTAVLANPHLPTGQDTATDDEVADRYAPVVLLALRNRADLLERLDGRLVAEALLAYRNPSGSEPPPSPLADLCRRVLHALPPGPAREAVCAVAVERGRYDGNDDEAAAVALAAGYRPADPAAVPLFLVRTGRWEELADVDPSGERLHAYCVRPAFGRDSGAGMIETLLGAVEDTGTPEPVREACRRALRDQEPGAAREHLCTQALQNDRPAALRAVVDGGLVPERHDEAAALLFLTEQWERYDAADPTGKRVRRYAGRLDYFSSERDRLREAARRGRRPMPCEASSSTPPHRTQYVPGGSSTSGTGGYTFGTSF